MLREFTVGLYPKESTFDSKCCTLLHYVHAYSSVSRIFVLLTSPLCKPPSPLHVVVALL